METALKNAKSGIMYEARIDHGAGGETEVEATSIDEALTQAIAWAREGDWPEGGCEVLVGVSLLDSRGQEADERSSTVRVGTVEVAGGC